VKAAREQKHVVQTDEEGVLFPVFCGLEHPDARVADFFHPVLLAEPIPSLVAPTQKVESHHCPRTSHQGFFLTQKAETFCPHSSCGDEKTNRSSLAYSLAKRPPVWLG